MALMTWRPCGAYRVASGVNIACGMAPLCFSVLFARAQIFDGVSKRAASIVWRIRESVRERENRI